MPSPAVLRGLELDIEGLKWICRFGYLRLQELGRLMYPDAAEQYQHQYAIRLATKWRKQDLVLTRKLPHHAGTVLVLARAGVHMLLDVNFRQAKSGKDIGSLSGDIWKPPLDWRHHIIASGFLAKYRSDFGCDIVTEHELKAYSASQNDCEKVHDGLFFDREKNTWIALEVESARKTGRYMRALVKAIIDTSGSKKTVAGKEVGGIAVAYDVAARDERSHGLDHRQRLMSAIANQARCDFSFRLAPCELSNFGLKNYQLVTQKVVADRITIELKSFSWRQEKDVLVGYAHGYERSRQYRISARGQIEVYDVVQRRIVRSSTTERTIERAKRLCAADALEHIDDDDV